ncbi:SDR family oxidoreductase [Fibrella sp. HMF5335]|uniref:SDR family oxidoreductase n=1 Tax=Fibrella rubiginis TaxID=2817060 RepID=A0A939K323_9BACT|nr:SDR family oxidoreductase [Fibrella rubiginis]MBO0935183.1 SDR family oxidoreductase [Fibrella rubiginis]
MSKLQGKVAVVTGGNSGIGFASAQAFLAEGADKVIITGRDQRAIDEAVELLGSRAAGIVANVADMAAIRQMGETLGTLTDHVDVLFVNAGVATFAPLEHMTEATFDHNMDVNFKGAFFSIQAVLPLMREGGSIVLNTSVNAHMGMAGASAYGASKAALVSLARNLSAELLPRKIRVNAVSPGPVGTPLFTTAKLGVDEEQLTQMGQHIAGLVPLGRFGHVDEIARTIVFFASDDSSFILGSELIVDGGMVTL